MKKKVTILPVENLSDAGSKGIFAVNKKKQSKVLPIELPTGDAGSKGIFQNNKK